MLNNFWVRIKCLNGTKDYFKHYISAFNIYECNTLDNRYKFDSYVEI